MSLFVVPTDLDRGVLQGAGEGDPGEAAVMGRVRGIWAIAQKKCARTTPRIMHWECCCKTFFAHHSGQGGDGQLNDRSENISPDPTIGVWGQGRSWRGGK